MTDKLYAADGVNVADEATFSSYAGKVCKESFKNSPFVEVHDLAKGHFRGPRPITFKGLPEGFYIELSADGIGTKGVLIDAADAFNTAAYDLVAMVSSDITRYGGVPLVLSNTLDLAEVEAEGSEINTKYKQLFAGLQNAMKEIRAVSLKGETAQMSISVSSEIPDSPTRFNWGATMVGAYQKDKMVTGDTLAVGQKVIALKEDGFRCNGISSVRKALAMQYGARWWNNPDAKADIKSAATPSVLYDSFVNTIHGWYASDWQPEITLHAIVHLSGGGIKEKFANDLVLARGMGAELDDLFEPAEIMKKCAKWRGIKDEEFYEAWNGGQGMLLVVDEEEADQTVARAADFGLTAKVCGTITQESKPAVHINSTLSGKKVTYGAAD